MSAVIITTNYGVEQDEIVEPLKALRAAEVPVTVAAVDDAPIETLVSDRHPGETLTPDTILSDIDPADYDVLVIPGGTINADTLRLDDDALALVRSFTDSGSTIAAICHGPWVLAEAGVAEGKTMTSYASIATDLRNAGATWVDEELSQCPGNGWLLLTSRSPGDLPAFSEAVVEAAR